MSKVLHTPSESTILSTWSSTSSISTLSSVADSSTAFNFPKPPQLQSSMLRTGSINELLTDSPFAREQKIAELVRNSDIGSTTTSGKPQVVFIHKLYDMLSNDSISHLIKWAPDASSFYVFPGEKFCKVLAQYFKHTNVSSFIRQLNMYGFHKVSDGNSTGSSDNKDSSRWEFRHSQNHFRKGDIESLKHIKRRSSKTVNVHKEVVDLKSIPHPGEYPARNPENVTPQFNSQYTTPSPSQPSRNGYPLYPYQPTQTLLYPTEGPVLPPTLHLQTQQVDRLAPKLKSPLTPRQPPMNSQIFNPRGPESTLPLPHALQGTPADYIHQRPPITTQFSFERKATETTETVTDETEFWKRKYFEVSADFDTLVDIVEKGTEFDAEYQKFKESRTARQLLHKVPSDPIAAPQADKASSLSTYYPQYKPKFNPSMIRQRADSKSYSPLGTTIAHREYYLHKHQQQVSLDSRIPSLVLTETQRTNSLPGEIQEPCTLSPNVKSPCRKRNSDPLISGAPRLPSVNELTMNLFNPSSNFKRKRSE